MTRVTNNTRETIDFTVGPGSKGIPETESIAAFETKTMSLTTEHAQFRTFAFMGAITIEGAAASKLDEEVAAASPAVNDQEPGPDPQATNQPRRRGGRRRKA